MNLQKARLHCTAVLATVLSTIAFTGTALGQSADDWQFQASIYLYFPAIDGHSSFPAGPGLDVEVDAHKILESLNFAFLGTLEARKGAWGVFTDVIYMDVGGSKSLTQDFKVGNLPIPAGATANARFDLSSWIWTFAVEQRAISSPTTSVDAFLGTRLIDVSETLSWQLSGNIGAVPLPGRGGVSDSTNSNWDAVVGFKGRSTFGAENKWFAPYYFDIGTGESDLTWQAMAGVGYTFGWGDILAAWRYLSYDMKSGKVEDLTLNGPLIAGVFRW